MGRAFMFMLFMWLIVNTAGAFSIGSLSVATTQLTADITAAEDASIPVTSTSGFLDTGVIDIEGERIAYPTTSGTAFEDTLTQDIIRGGTGGTDAAAHASGAIVRTVPSSMANSVVGYNIAVLADASGLWAAPTIALALLRLLASFFTLPLSFLGTDLEILTYLWWVMAAGMIFTFAMSLAGGRRV